MSLGTIMASMVGPNERQKHAIRTTNVTDDHVMRLQNCCSISTVTTNVLYSLDSYFWCDVTNYER